MKKIDRVKFIDKTLNKLYPKPKPSLKYKTNYQLLIAVILSAQCTDVRVNEVTSKLFADRPGPNAILDLGKDGLIAYIRPCGLFNSKSKSILGMTKVLVERRQGNVPDEFEDLVKLSGVGEKTAAVMMIHAFDKPAFPVDTHILRLARRLDLSKNNDPSKVSADLKKLFPEKRWKDLHLQFIFHGRQVCSAREPGCVGCGLLEVCLEGRGRMKSLKLKKVT